MENETYNSTPYLSVVMISRNDDYAGGMLPRLQASVNYLLSQLEAKKIEAELIIVDWNPPQNKPLLREALALPEDLHYSSVRVLEVPPLVHQRYKYWEKRPMHGAVAINTGIRRARGQFIVLMVSDAFWSEELITFISERKLEKGYLYRCDRVDSKIDFSPEKYKSENYLLNEIKNNIVTRNKRVPYPEKFEGVAFPPLHTNAAGDFQLMHRDHFQKLCGYYETKDVGSFFVDGLLSFAAYVSGIKEKVLPDEMCVYKIVHSNMCVARCGKELISSWENLFAPSFLPNALKELIKNRFRSLFGYPKVDYQGIPCPSYPEYLRICRNMLSGKKPYVLNTEDWGLIKDRLEENIMIAADWDTADKSC